jgi:ribosome maturation factor RimP
LLQSAGEAGPRFFLTMELSLVQLTAEIRRRVSDLGYELVDLRKRGAGSRIGLQLRRGRFRATIVGVQPNNDVVVLAPTGEPNTVEVPLDRIRDATLVVDWEAVERQRAERRSQ